MDELDDKVAGLLNEALRLSAQYSSVDSPVLRGQQLSVVQGQKFDFELPHAESGQWVQLSFNVDRFGDWEGNEFSIEFGTAFIDCGVVVVISGLSFGIVLIGDGTPLRELPGFLAWETFANSAVPILWSFPEIGIPVLPSRTAALASFVFRAVYGTDFAKADPPYCMIEDVWAATHIALAKSRTMASRAACKLDSQETLNIAGVAIEPKPKRGNPGISIAEADLRLEILAVWHREGWSTQIAAENLYPVFGDRVRHVLPQIGKRNRTVETVSEFMKYLTACEDWDRKRRSPSSTARKKRKDPRKNSSE